MTEVPIHWFDLSCSDLLMPCEETNTKNFEVKLTNLGWNVKS